MLSNQSSNLVEDAIFFINVMKSVQNVKISEYEVKNLKHEIKPGSSKVKPCLYNYSKSIFDTTLGTKRSSIISEMSNKVQKVNRTDNVRQNQKSTDSNRKKHLKWTKDEDYQLRLAVEMNGAQGWDNISRTHLKGIRSGAQCLHRWKKVMIIISNITFVYS